MKLHVFVGMFNGLVSQVFVFVDEKKAKREYKAWTKHKYGSKIAKFEDENDVNWSGTEIWTCEI